MFYFVTCGPDVKESACKMFNTVEALFDWIGKYKAEYDETPKNLCVFSAKCLMDLG